MSLTAGKLKKMLVTSVAATQLLSVIQTSSAAANTVTSETTTVTSETTTVTGAVTPEETTQSVTETTTAMNESLFKVDVTIENLNTVVKSLEREVVKAKGQEKIDIAKDIETLKQQVAELETTQTALEEAIKEVTRVEIVSTNPSTNGVVAADNGGKLTELEAKKLEEEIAAKAKAEEEAKKKEEEAKAKAEAERIAYENEGGVKWTTNSKLGSESPDTYAWGNCTWYVKERLGSKIGDFWGNGNDWMHSAKRDGVETGTKPVVGAVFSQYGGQGGSHPQYGHVSFIAEVSADGTMVRLDEMNAVGLNIVSTHRWVPADSGVYIYVK